MTRLLFVCTGNICRSPTAEAVARSVASQRGVVWHVDSAGTSAWHVGEAPDPRAIDVAVRRGHDLAGIRSRALVEGDFSRFDHLIALDRAHLHEMRRVPVETVSGRLSLLLDWAPGREGEDVPDPYYGDEAEFARALELIELGVNGLADALQRRG
jgi:protein-tyrosine phosphatase